MAESPEAYLVSVYDYLNSTWQPDLEFVDGVLVERGHPGVAHSILQTILIQHFANFRSALNFVALSEARTQIVEGDRYRIPDIQLCPKPLPKDKVVTITPPVVIEIVSPNDTLGEWLRRLRDYSSIGVGTIVQMDPEACIAHRFENGSLIETRFDHLTLRHTDAQIPFDSDALFQQLRSDLCEAPEF